MPDLSLKRLTTNEASDGTGDHAVELMMIASICMAQIPSLQMVRLIDRSIGRDKHFTDCHAAAAR